MIMMIKTMVNVLGSGINRQKITPTLCYGDRNQVTSRKILHAECW